VIQARTKLVTFRLSEDEYEHLRAVSAARGARSVSEFVRSSVGWIVENCDRQLWEVIVTSGQRAMPPGAGPRRTPDAGEKA
jgi:hypothetical protein